MVIGNGVNPDDGEGGGTKHSVACSICFDLVTDDGERSWAKLQCGHKFHLDCIGSAFNVKGAMQCPNCRKIEKGQWLYANGSRPIPDFSMDDWAHDDDLYDISYSDISLGVHWCPFSGLPRLSSSFEEGDFSPTAYPDLLGHHAVFAEHAPVSSTSHPCPYVAYFGPVHPSSTASNTSVSDGSSFHNIWNGPSVPSEFPNSYAFPSMDLHYHTWDPSPPFAATNRVDSADQSVSSMTQRAGRNSSDIPRPGIHPFFLGHSSASRAPSAITASPIAAFIPRQRDRTSHPASFQQSTSNPAPRPPVLSSRRRSSNLRGLAQVAPNTSSPDPSNGFYISTTSSARSFQEPENPLHERFNVWEWEPQMPSYPQGQGQVDRGSNWRFHPQSETGSRSSVYGQRHGSDRQNR